MKFYSESSNYPEVRRQCVAYARALRGAGIKSNAFEWYELRVRWAVCARVEGDPETARRYVRRNIKFGRRDGRQKELIQALLQLALIERYVDAMERRATLEEAMEVAEKLGEPKELAEVRNAMGELYADEGRTEEARAYFQAVIDQGHLEHDGLYASALNGHQERMLRVITRPLPNMPTEQPSWPERTVLDGSSATACALAVM